MNQQISGGRSPRSFEDLGIRGVNYQGAENQKVVCPFCPEHTKNHNARDMSVNIRTLVYHCFRCAAKGKIGPSTSVTAPRVVKPLNARVKRTSPDAKLYEFLGARGISRETLDECKVTATMRSMGQDKNGEWLPPVWVICFNYYRGDDLVNVKYRDSVKDFRQTTGGAPIAYMENNLLDVDTCIITEGEIDALSFYEAGHRNVVSTPHGAFEPKDKDRDKRTAFLDWSGEHFDRMATIYLALDDDVNGRTTSQEYAQRLGVERCMLVRYPDGMKDGNEVLQKLGTEALRACILRAEPYPVAGVFDVNSQRDSLMDIRQNGFPVTPPCGIDSIDELLRFALGTLTTISGVPFHGKSTLLDFLLVRMSLLNNWKSGLFTPENYPPSIHVIRLLEQTIGKPYLKTFNGFMTDEEIAAGLAYLQEHFYYVLPDDDNFTLDKILEGALFLIRRKGIKAFVIDAWNMIEHHRDKSELQTDYAGRVLNRLRFFARKNNIALFLIAHPKMMGKVEVKKKGGGKEKVTEVPTMYDISGSAHFANMSDNGVIVYRKYSEDMKTSVTEFKVVKVKHKFHGMLGTAELDFEISNQRFRKHGTSIDRSNYLLKLPEVERPEEYVPAYDDDEDPF